MPHWAPEEMRCSCRPLYPVRLTIIHILLLPHQKGEGIPCKVCHDPRLLLGSGTQSSHILKRPQIFEASLLISHQSLGPQSGKRRGVSRVYPPQYLLLSSRPQCLCLRLWSAFGDDDRGQGRKKEEKTISCQKVMSVCTSCQTAELREFCFLFSLCSLKKMVNLPGSLK